MLDGMGSGMSASMCDRIATASCDRIVQRHGARTDGRTDVDATRLDFFVSRKERAQGGRTIYPTPRTKLTDRPTLRAAKCTHPEVVNG